MLKLTVLYGHPASATDFETYYAGTHLPLAAKMRGVSRLELTKFEAGPDGGRPEYYRMAELYFGTRTDFEQAVGSPEGRAAVADLSNFATGGVTVLVGAVQE
jgi:uncharacterized protein (TIGR02118 family)